MDADTAIGCGLVTGALSLITWFVVWGNRTIQRIAARRLRTARDILRDLESDG